MLHNWCVVVHAQGQMHHKQRRMLHTKDFAQHNEERLRHAEILEPHNEGPVVHNEDRIVHNTDFTPHKTELLQYNDAWVVHETMSAPRPENQKPRFLSFQPRFSGRIVLSFSFRLLQCASPPHNTSAQPHVSPPFVHAPERTVRMDVRVSPAFCGIDPARPLVNKYPLHSALAGMIHSVFPDARSAFALELAWIRGQEPAAVGAPCGAAGGGGSTRRAARTMRAVFRRCMDAPSKNSVDARGPGAHGCAQGVSTGASFWFRHSDSGHPALRPSGRLRRSRRSCGAVDKEER